VVPQLMLQIRDVEMSERPMTQFGSANAVSQGKMGRLVEKNRIVLLAQDGGSGESEMIAAAKIQCGVTFEKAARTVFNIA
jgi:hypothetical protein